MTTQTVTEQFADWHAGRTVDRSERTVRNVALAGLHSKNGYRYTEQALREAARLYESRPVFLDHAGDKSRPHERSTRDLVGTIVRPRFEQGRIRADVRVLDTESGRTFLALAESDAPGVGMSHVVLAERATGDGAVERIREVVSVDAVVFPATTTTFRESVSGETSDRAVPCEGEAPAEPGCGVKSESRQALDESDTSDRVRALLRERDALQAELQALRERDTVELRARRLDRQLAAAGLPAFAVIPAWREQLLRCRDDEGIARLISERLELIAAARRVSPVSSERAVSGAAGDTTAFVAAIKRHTR